MTYYGRRFIFGERIKIDRRTVDLWISSDEVKNTDYWRIKTKLTGVSFKPFKGLATCSRRKIINSIVSSMSDENIRTLLTKDYVYPMNHSSLSHRAKWLYNFIVLKRELTNEYDPNAIVVLISGKLVADLFKGDCPDTIDIGYIPKVIAGVIVEQNLTFTLVGIKFPSGGNILLDIFLKRKGETEEIIKRIKKKKGWDKTVRDIGFTSLNKIRRLLEE